MNEPKFPVHEGLHRFEQDLKSLTPKNVLEVLPVKSKPSSHDLVFRTVPVVGLVTDEPLHRLPMQNRDWLKIATVSWVMGLAAGLLVSAIWIGIWDAKVPITEPNIVSQNVAKSEVTNASPEVAFTQNPPSAELFRSQQPAAFQDEFFGGTSRFNAIDLAGDYVLRPFMWQNAVNGGMTFAEVDSASRLKNGQTDVPNSSTKSPSTPIPYSFPKCQSQRQLLKMLLESDTLNSI